MKRLFAALAALTMLAAVGCGSVEKTENDSSKGKDKPKSNEGIIVNAEDSGNSDEDDGSEDENDNDDGGLGEKAASLSGLVNDDNAIIDDSVQDENNDPYDKETLYRMTEMCVDQFNTILSRDKQAYLDSVNVSALLKSDAMKEIFLLMLNDGVDAADFSEAESRTLVYALMMLENLDETEVQAVEDEYNTGKISSEEAGERLFELVKEMSDELTPDNVSMLFDTYSTWDYLFNEEYGHAPEGLTQDPESFSIVPTEGMLFGIEIDSYVSNDHGIFAELDIDVACGDWEYGLDECFIWISGDESFVYISDMDIEENSVKGMTKEEVIEQSAANDAILNANSCAKSAYNSIAEYFADQETQGRGMDTVVADGDFEQALSDEGLSNDIAPAKLTVMEESGDKAILNELYNYSTKGVIHLGFTEINGEETFFVQFKNSDGIIGQYPSPIDSERESRVRWCEYLSSGSDS